MARAKRRELVGVLEQRRQKREVALELAHGGDAPLELGRIHDDGIAAESPRVIREQRRTRDGEQMRILRLDAIACRKPERPAKRMDEVRHVLERTAQEDDVAADGTPAGKPRQRLAHDGVEDARGDVGLARAGVEQRTHVGLREHGAPRGDRVAAARAKGQLAHLAAAHVEHVGDGVDEAAGSARARRVHALFGSLVEVDALRVLAAKFDDDVGVRLESAHGVRRGDDLLHEGDAEDARDLDRGRAGHDDRRVDRTMAPVEVVYGLAQRACDVGAMAHVGVVDDGARLVEHDELECLGTGVDADAIRHGRPRAGETDWTGTSVSLLYEAENKV